jgi:hypothetical protein
MNAQIVYDAIVTYWQVYSVPPSLQRVAELVPCGRTTAYYYVCKLEKLGLIERVDRHPLPIEIKQYLKLFVPKGKESL